MRLDRLKSVLKMFLSTSPNLPLVASLDVARKQMATEGTKLLTRTIELARETRERINRIDGLYCFGEDMIGRNGVFDLDPTKIAVTVKELGYTGYEASEILRHRYNIQVELADLFNVVALFTIGTTPEAADRLALAFEEMARDDRPVDMYAPSGILERRLRRGSYRLPKIPPMRMSPRDAFLADAEFVHVQRFERAGSVPKRSRRIRRGFRSSRRARRSRPNLIDYLRLEMKAGVRIQGPYDDRLKVGSRRRRVRFGARRR